MLRLLPNYIIVTRFRLHRFFGQHQATDLATSITMSNKPLTGDSFFSDFPCHDGNWSGQATGVSAHHAVQDMSPQQLQAMDMQGINLPPHLPEQNLQRQQGHSQQQDQDMGDHQHKATFVADPILPSIASAATDGQVSEADFENHTLEDLAHIL
jgi:hypothetical protein